MAHREQRRVDKGEADGAGELGEVGLLVGLDVVEREPHRAKGKGVRRCRLRRFAWTATESVGLTVGRRRSSYKYYK